MICRLNCWIGFGVENIAGRNKNGSACGLGSDDQVNIETDHPEFAEWKWIDQSEMVDAIVPFKQMCTSRFWIRLGLQNLRRNKHRNRASLPSKSRVCDALSFIKM